MNSPMEDRLREALTEAGATIDTSTLRPLHRAKRSRFRVDLRLVAVAAVVVLVGVAGVVGLGGSGDVNHAVAVNPEPDRQKGKGEMAIFLCSKAVPKERLCQGRDVTAEETKAVDTLVRQLPEVEAVVFVDKARSYENFRRDFVHNKALLDSVGADDLPASFRLTIREGADRNQVSRALLGVAGIQNVGDLSSAMVTDMERVRSEIRAFLCVKGTGQSSCGGDQVLDGEGILKRITKEGKAATNAEKNALRKLIDSLPDVESFTFRDQAAAYEDFQKKFADNEALLKATKVTDMPEFFVLTMKPKVDWSETISKLQRQPGVATVVNGTCAADKSQLLVRYGLTLPDSKVCPGGT